MASAQSIRFASLVLALGAASGTSQAQQILSAQSGTLHYTEGTVYLDGKEIQPKHGEFASMRNGQELRTENSRAEVLLTPGAFLRVGDHSAVRMVNTQLFDTRIEILSGSAIAECDELLKDNSITLLYAGNTIHLEKHGLYRIDTNPAQLRVFDGQALVQSNLGDLRVKGGRETSLDASLIAERFSRKNNIDDLYEWDASRSLMLASASVNASQSLLNGNMPWTTSGWGWSPYYGTFTFVPAGDAYIFSPFGYQFWSPVVMSIYYQPVNYSAANGSYGSPNNGVGNGARNDMGGDRGRSGLSSPGDSGRFGGGGGIGGGRSAPSGGGRSK